ncbi:MAG TPA: DUF3667 domain-containing protein [Chitinophagaceae bacterium]|nr:DUF3667 domain-containing protein [Chitinophagaceae bacterium]
MLTADDRFCPSCGQKTDTPRLNMKHIWHEVFHAFTHTDKGFIHVMKELLRRPGHVAREYVEGKRKRYFNPFSFLIIVVAVTTFLVSSFDLMAMGRKDPISVFINKHANFIIFLNVPIDALFTWLFFIRSGKTYAENLVLSAYASGERSVFYSLVVVPLMLAMPQHSLKVIYVYLAAWVLYKAWAATQFFSRRDAWGYTRGIVAAFLPQVIIYCLIFAAYYIYFRYYR